jgi:indole-3-glycerol phosphate synthase
MTSILDRILTTKRAEVESLQRTAVAFSPPDPPDAGRRDRFEAALRRGTEVRLIGEIKRRSPSAGAIRAEADPAAIAAIYEAAGASALSVLTDAQYFGGSLADLAAARAACSLPILRKDFIIDELQVGEARAYGADAVLLIVAALSDDDLRRLSEAAERWGLAAIIEVHNEAEMRRAANVGARIIGINNRNLATFETDLGTTVRLAPQAPKGTLLVSESGLQTRADVELVAAAAVDAILVGGGLMTSPDPGAKVRELVGRS